MKIMFCIDSLNKGGAERVITNMANEFCGNNEVTIVTTTSTRSEYFVDERVKLYSLDNEVIKSFKNVRRVIALKKIIDEVLPDVIVTFMAPQSFRVLSIKSFVRAKVIVSVRNDPNREYAGVKNKIAMKLLYNNADGFVFQTQQAKEFFNKKIQKKSTIIPNPINEKFIVDRYEGERNKEIVAVGRLEEQKNYFLLLDTYKELLKYTDEYKLLIYGEGKKRLEIERYISENNLSTKVIMKGNVDNLEQAIYKSSIYILSSIYEGMPNALMEAMALGLPCIATNCPCGGPEFLIQHGKDGMLVENNNKEEMLSTILKFINNPQFMEQCGINANKKMKKFTTKTINDKWLSYIKSVELGKKYNE